MKALWQSTEPRHDTFMVECYIILRDSPGRACAVGAVVGVIHKVNVIKIERIRPKKAAYAKVFLLANFAAKTLCSI